MTANPLLTGQPKGGGKLTLYDLEAYVMKCNNYNWVAASGKLYFVAKRTLDNGEVEHFLDRAA